MSSDPRDPSAGNVNGEGNDVPRDDALRALYRQLPPEEPRAEVDEAIRAAARKAIGAGPRASAAGAAAYRRTLRWAVPLATAASLVLVVMMLREEHPERAGVPVAVQESAVMEQERAPVAAEEARPEIAAETAVAVERAAVEGSAAVGKGEATAGSAVARQEEASAPPVMADDAVSIAAVGAGSGSASGGGSAMPQAAAVAERDEPVARDIVAEDVAEQEPAREEIATRSMEKSSRTAKASVSAPAMQAPVPPPATALAPVKDTEATWPFTTVPGARIAAGPLAGFTLRERSGSEAEGRAVFHVSGDEGASAAWQEQVAARLAAAGWRERTDCAPRTFASDSAQVTLTFAPGELVVSWFAEGVCR